MSTRPEFVQYLLDQLEGLGELRARKMFGDYLVYLNDRPALLVCDGTPFAKPLPCVAELLKDRPTAPPYEGAKAHYVLDPEDRDTLRWAAGCSGTPAPPPGAGFPRRPGPGHSGAWPPHRGRRRDGPPAALPHRGAS